MQAKFVFITELKSDKTKTGKDYWYALDQDKQRWNFFNGEKVELQKGYVFDYEMSGDFMNVKVIKPVVNIFQQKALKDLANINDIKRELQVCLSYSKDITIATQKFDKVEMFSLAYEMYDWLNSTADKLMPKTEDSK